MDVDVTEPIPEITTGAERIRQQLTPSRVIAGISTTVAVVAVTALIWVTGDQPEAAPPKSPSPAVAASGPAASAKPVAAHPAPPAPEAAPPAPSTKAPVPAAPAAPAASSSGGVADFLNPTRRSPSAPEGDRSGAPPVSWPTFDRGAIPPDVNWPAVAAQNGWNPQSTVDTIIGAVTGTAGWIGSGSMDLLGNVIIASSNANQGGRPTQPADALAALMLGPAATAGAGFPNMPPPPQVDWSRIPPPHVDWSRIPPPQLPPPPQMPRIEDPFAKLPSITRAIGLPF